MISRIVLAFIVTLLSISNSEGKFLLTKWCNWSSWSECSVSCDKGTQSRTRTCQCASIDLRIIFQSEHCPGASSERRECLTELKCDKKGSSEDTPFSIAYVVFAVMGSIVILFFLFVCISKVKHYLLRRRRLQQRSPGTTSATSAAAGDSSFTTLQQPAYFADLGENEEFMSMPVLPSYDDCMKKDHCIQPPSYNSVQTDLELQQLNLQCMPQQQAPSSLLEDNSDARLA